MKDAPRPWIKRIAIACTLLVLVVASGRWLVAQADGPFFIFAGGPFRSGDPVRFDEMDWSRLDTLHELQMEIVGDATSLTLWFSVHEGAAYVACDLDCVDGKLSRWPVHVERDNRVVLRIEGQNVEGRLSHVPHGTEEYTGVRAGRKQKYSGEGGGRAASETAAHGAVVNVGEALTGRANRTEPGDRLYRFDPR